MPAQPALLGISHKRVYLQDSDTDCENLSALSLAFQICYITRELKLRDVVPRRPLSKMGPTIILLVSVIWNYLLERLANEYAINLGMNLI